MTSKMKLTKQFNSFNSHTILEPYPRSALTLLLLLPRTKQWHEARVSALKC